MANEATIEHGAETATNVDKASLNMWLLRQFKCAARCDEGPTLCSDTQTAFTQNPRFESAAFFSTGKV